MQTRHLKTHESSRLDRHTDPVLAPTHQTSQLYTGWRAQPLSVRLSRTKSGGSRCLSQALKRGSAAQLAILSAEPGFLTTVLPSCSRDTEVL